MLQNGTLTTVRVIMSGILSITAIAGAIWLMHDNIPIPTNYWAVVVIGISGVTGADIIAYLIKLKGGGP